MAIDNLKHLAAPPFEKGNQLHLLRKPKQYLPSISTELKRLLDMNIPLDRNAYGKLKDELKRVMRLEGGGKFRIREALAIEMLIKALEGNVSFVNMVLDRTEGKVKSTEDVEKDGQQSLFIKIVKPEEPKLDIIENEQPLLEENPTINLEENDKDHSSINDSPRDQDLSQAI